MGLSGNNVNAIDINDDFINIAKTKKKFFCTPIIFNQLKMQDIVNSFQANTIDLIVCVGNTLPHISKEEQIKFLNDSKLLLKDEGKLILQFFNFSILDNENNYIFPDIKNEELIFKRTYININDKEVQFDIQLILSENNRTLKDTNILNKIDLKLFKEELNKIGFTNQSFYEDFNKSPFNKDNNSIIIELQK